MVLLPKNKKNNILLNHKKINVKINHN